MFQLQRGGPEFKVTVMGQSASEGNVLPSDIIPVCPLPFSPGPVLPVSQLDGGGGGALRSVGG